MVQLLNQAGTAVLNAPQRTSMDWLAAAKSL